VTGVQTCALPISRSQHALGFDEGVDTAAQAAVGDTNESPWLHQADTRCAVGGVQQSLQHLGVDRPRHEVADISTLGNRAIHRFAVAGAKGMRIHHSTPFCALTPSRKACFTSSISLSVSAISRNAGAAPRPVMMTC